MGMYVESTGYQAQLPYRSVMEPSVGAVLSWMTWTKPFRFHRLWYRPSIELFAIISRFSFWFGVTLYVNLLERFDALAWRSPVRMKSRNRCSLYSDVLRR